MSVRWFASMEMVAVVHVVAVLFITVDCMPRPGEHHHVRHRIHVPQKIKTIYHTKIVKVPEHHHYFHEKEKIITVPVNKEHHETSFHALEDNDWEGSNNFGEDEHNVFKKHAPVSSFRKGNASDKSKRTSLPTASYAKTSVPTNSSAHVKPPSKKVRPRSPPRPAVARDSRPNRAGPAPARRKNNSSKLNEKPKNKPKHNRGNADSGHEE